MSTSEPPKRRSSGYVEKLRAHDMVPGERFRQEPEAARERGHHRGSNANNNGPLERRSVKHKVETLRRESARLNIDSYHPAATRRSSMPPTPHPFSWSGSSGELSKGDRRRVRKQNEEISSRPKSVSKEVELQAA
ncbi:hypothetical protein MCOR27_009903 [Pyricularia oryzae]|nr:hypothetical protein MCOR19_009622 [Pyricularia oryzae]KAI6264241.1 hypothetical protein MCOR26_011484 [Pyricularia oryzae]KAI6269042.1 hypothetical protein MCOR27_009903 [Pyricularia oryzae]KAI6295459.1 hypothetical protein MCOR29_011405 [Pyricularia oryzae]KAI6308524.1 hypothetical protein MCOR30_011458 [Pyricularia oryzae]